MEKNIKKIKKTTVYAIIGPTCIGKTSLALDLCNKYNGEIISFDSRQIYKFMDIGTGKIPCNDKEKISKTKNFWIVDGIKIYGYDLVDPDKNFSSYNFTIFALNKIKKILKSNKKIFLVGGTGFYLDAVTGRVKPSSIPPNFDLRKKLNSYSLIKLQSLLKNKDEKIFNKIDKNNPVRIIRAIEKISGKTKNKILNYPNNIEYKIIGLRAERDFLYSRADAWIDCIWHKDFEKEVQKLLKSKYKNSPKLNGIIYKSMKAYLTRNLTYEDSKVNAKFDMHGYIRRQQTYFKKIPGIIWLDIDKDNFKKKLYNIIK